MSSSESMKENSDKHRNRKDKEDRKDMNIRQAYITDLDKLAEIEGVSYPEAESASKESIRARIIAFSECFWVLEDEGEILGFINGMTTDHKDLADEMYESTDMYDPDGEYLMIFSVVTAPKHRNHGYAGTIMERVISDSKIQGRKEIVLTCKERLLPFYGKFGYVNEGISDSTHGNVSWYQMRLGL